MLKEALPVRGKNLDLVMAGWIGTQVYLCKYVFSVETKLGLALLAFLRRRQCFNEPFLLDAFAVGCLQVGHYMYFLHVGSCPHPPTVAGKCLDIFILMKGSPFG